MHVYDDINAYRDLCYDSIDIKMNTENCNEPETIALINRQDPLRIMVVSIINFE